MSGFSNLLNKFRNQPTNWKYILIIIIFVLSMGGLVVYQNILEFPRIGSIEKVNVISTKNKEVVTAELMETESIVCNNETYIFDTVLLEGKGFFNDIYKTFRSPENFIVRLKSPEKNFFGIFSIVAIPKKDCDRIYLTSHIWASDVPAIGIFEWQISGKEVRELAVSREFSSNYVYGRNEWISSDGEKIIVAQPSRIRKENWRCDYRVLRLLRLREDKSELLVQLLNEETFDNGNSEQQPYCEGLNFGWLNESEIYYNVYDATTERNRPLLERRTLLINKRKI